MVITTNYERAKIMSALESQFNSIYTANYSKVFRLCMGYFNGNEEIAKDITQEVFVKVWENMSSFRNQAKISTWVYRIAVNTCLLQIRNSKKERNLNSYPHVTTDDNSKSAIEHEMQLKQMYGCINKLNSTNRAIILLELENVPQKEIAAIVGVSHQALRTRVNRIKNSLTKCIKKNGL